MPRLNYGDQWTPVDDAWLEITGGHLYKNHALDKARSTTS